MSYYEKPGSPNRLDWLLCVPLIIVIILIAWWAAPAVLGAATPHIVDETYVGTCNGGVATVTYQATYEDGEWARSQDIHCDGGLMPWTVERGGARGEAGLVTMPDGVTLDPNEPVEWILDTTTGNPTNWSTGNNYAVTGSDHATRQREMLEFLNQNLTDEPRPPRVKIMLTTASEFLARMARAGLMVGSFLAVLDWIPAAAAANEGAEIFSDEDYVDILTRADLLERIAQGAPVVPGQAVRGDRQRREPRPWVAVEYARDAIMQAIYDIEYEDDLWVWDEKVRKWSNGALHYRSGGEWRVIGKPTEAQKRGVATRLVQRYPGTNRLDWLARRTTDGDMIPFAASEAFERTRNPNDLWAHPTAQVDHIGGLVDVQVQRLLDLSPNAFGPSGLFLSGGVPTITAETLFQWPGSMDWVQFDTFVWE